MTVNDIVTLACSDCGDTGPAMTAFATSALRLKYEIAFNRHNWNEAMIDPPQEFDLAAPILIPPLPGASTSLSFYQVQPLPLAYDKIIWVKGSTDGGMSFAWELRPRDRSWIEHNDGSSFVTQTNPNVPRWYYTARPVGFPVLSPLILTFTPQNSPTQIALTVEGIDVNGLEQQDTFSVSGSTAASTVNSYREVHTISKSPYGPTVVPIIVTCSGAATSVNWSGNDEILRYPVVGVWPSYQTTPAFRIKVGGKRKVDNLANGASIPMVSSLYQTLYYAVRASIHGKQRQGDAEKSDIAMAEEQFQIAKRKELNESGKFMQIQPKVYDDPGQVWDWWGWTDSGY